LRSWVASSPEPEINQVRTCLVHLSKVQLATRCLQFYWFVSWSLSCCRRVFNLLFG
jgi:hypothetical protein